MSVVRVRRRLVAVLLGLVGVVALVLAGPAPATAGAGPRTVAVRTADNPTAGAYYACHKTDLLDGTYTQLVHWFHCKHLPFETVYATDPTASAADPAAAAGPPCYWYAARFAKICYPGTHPTVLCMRWFAGDYYSDNCGPVEYYNRTHLNDGVNWLHGVGGAAKACAVGAVGPGVSGLIVRLAGGGWLGFFAGTVGGCLGGVLRYAW
jgi:hypothetical protein